MDLRLEHALTSLEFPDPEVAVIELGHGHAEGRIERRGRQEIVERVDVIRRGVLGGHRSDRSLRSRVGLIGAIQRGREGKELVDVEVCEPIRRGSETVDAIFEHERVHVVVGPRVYGA